MKTRKPTHERGFSLVEVIIGVTILAMMTGSLYMVFDASIQAAADLESAELQDEALYHFIDLCRDTLERLPSDAGMTCEIIDEGNQIQEFVLTGVPAAFSFGEDPVAGAESSLTIKLQPYELPSGEVTEAPLYQIAINRDDFAPDAEAGQIAIRMGADDEFFQADEDGRYWLNLLPGIESMQWGFWNEDEEIWDEFWEEGATRPLMVQLLLQPQGRAAPMRMVFDIPGDADSVQPNSQAQPAPAAAGGGGGAPRQPDAQPQPGQDGGRPPGDGRGPPPGFGPKGGGKGGPGGGKGGPKGGDRGSGGGPKGGGAPQGGGGPAGGGGAPKGR